MTASGNGPNDFLNEISRQAVEVGSRALGNPRRLDDSLAGMKQGDLQVQIRAGETDPLLRRRAIAQQWAGQAFLLGVQAAVPPLLGLPVGLGWLKLQGQLRRSGRLEPLPNLP